MGGGSGGGKHALLKKGIVTRMFRAAIFIMAKKLVAIYISSSRGLSN